MNLKRVQQTFQRLGRSDPLWAVLSLPEMKGNRWDVDAFFETGKADIERLLAPLPQLGLTLPFRRALDFGCGVGRLSQALCAHFDTVVGIDIAPMMLNFARRYNRHGEQCTYQLNETNDLRVFASGRFDFICSLITFQHMPPRNTRRYLEELLRVLAPGGVMALQLAAAFVRPSARGRIAQCVAALKDATLSLRQTLRTVLPQTRPGIEMFVVPRERITAWLEARGGRLLRVADEHSVPEHFVSFLYYVTK